MKEFSKIPGFMQILLSKACPSGKTKWYVLKAINFTFQVAAFSVFAFAVVVAFFDPFREVLHPLFLCAKTKGYG